MNRPHIEDYREKGEVDLTKYREDLKRYFESIDNFKRPNIYRNEMEGKHRFYHPSDLQGTYFEDTQEYMNRLEQEIEDQKNIANNSFSLYEKYEGLYKEQLQKYNDLLERARKVYSEPYPIRDYRSIRLLKELFPELNQQKDENDE